MEAPCEGFPPGGSSESEAVALVEKLGNPTHILDGKRECREASLLAFALKSATYEVVDRLLAEDPAAPVISMHMADGWSGDIRQTSEQKLRGNALVIRKGKLRHESLLVRSIAKKKKKCERMVGHSLVFEPAARRTCAVGGMCSKGSAMWHRCSEQNEPRALPSNLSSSTELCTFVFGGASWCGPRCTIPKWPISERDQNKCGSWTGHSCSVVRLMLGRLLFNGA